MPNRLSDMSKESPDDVLIASFEELRKRTPPAVIGQLALLFLTIFVVASQDALNTAIIFLFTLTLAMMVFRWVVAKNIQPSKRLRVFLLASIFGSNFSWSLLISTLIYYGTDNPSLILGTIILVSGLTAAASYSLGPVLKILYFYNISIILSLVLALLWQYTSIHANGHNEHIHIHWTTILYFVAYLGFTLKTGKIAYNDWLTNFQSRLELQAIFDSFPGGVYLFSNGKLKLTNQWIQYKFAINPKSLLQKTINEIKDSLALPFPVTEFIASKQIEHQLEMPLKTLLGERQHIVILKRLSQNDDSVLIVIVDIEDQIRIQAENNRQRIQLINASRLASLGEMSAGLAHEINNPLSVILAQTELLQRRLKKEINKNTDAILPVLEKIEQMGLRITRIIKGLSLFAQDGKAYPLKKISLLSVIEESLSFCEARFLKAQIQLNVDVDPEINIYGRSTQLSQVFLNLLNNSYEALQAQEIRWVQIQARSKENLIEIKVTDSGADLDTAIKDKMMQPFFTTKEPGKGIGLGLSISQGIITDHRGEIYVDPNAVYTTIIIVLPTAQEMLKTLKPAS